MSCFGSYNQHTHECNDCKVVNSCRRRQKESSQFSRRKCVKIYRKRNLARVLHLIHSRPGLSSYRISKVLDLNYDQAYESLKELYLKGQVVYSLKGRFKYWRVKA